MPSLAGEGRETGGLAGNHGSRTATPEPAGAWPVALPEGALPSPRHWREALAALPLTGKAAGVRQWYRPMDPGFCNIR